MKALTSTLGEIALVGGVGLLVALAANAASDGIDLGRDYFPTVTLRDTTTGTGDAPPAAGTGGPADRSPGDATLAPSSTAGTANDPAATAPPAGDTAAADAASSAGGPTDDPAAAEVPGTLGAGATLTAEQQAVADRLAAKGLQAIAFEDVAATFQDPMRGYGLHVFVDARDEGHYRDGHIPGALPFDYYKPDAYLADVTAALAAAMKVVIYCNGGDCEDSEFAALFLQGYVADPSALFVYTGGITEWRERGMPVELGARDSGDIQDG